MVQRWRCPTVLRVKAVVIAVIGAVVALVFLPLWFGVPVAALLALWAAGMTVAGSSVVINPEAGLLVFGMGLITRRVRLTDITAVLVDRSKVSVPGRPAARSRSTSGASPRSTAGFGFRTRPTRSATRSRPRSR